MFWHILRHCRYEDIYTYILLHSQLPSLCYFVTKDSPEENNGNYCSQNDPYFYLCAEFKHISLAAGGGSSL